MTDCIFPSRQRTENISISNELTPEQIREAESLIEQYPDVLTSLRGRTDIIRHNIKLLTTEPVRSNGYRIPYKTRDVMETEIQEMLDLGVIEPSVSPYSLSAVLVHRFPETERSYRIRTEPMQNQCRIRCRTDAEPMPNMVQMINRLSGYKYFTKIDLSKGYLQVELIDESKPLTAFETPR